MTARRSTCFSVPVLLLMSNLSLSERHMQETPVTNVVGNTKLGLTECELGVLRDLAAVAEDTDPLKQLSQPGKAIIDNPAVAFTVVHGDGTWEYRHVGSDRRLIARDGLPSDLRWLEEAMRSSEYADMTPRGPCTFQMSSLMGMASQPVAGERLGSVITILEQADELSPRLRARLVTRVGQALRQLPEPMRAIVLEHPEHGDRLSGAVLQADLLELQRLRDIIGGRSLNVSDEWITTLLTNNLIETPTARVGSMNAYLITSLSRDKDQPTVISVDAGPELRFYLSAPSGFRLADKRIHSATTLARFLAMPDVTAFVATEDASVATLDAATVELIKRAVSKAGST